MGKYVKWHIQSEMALVVNERAGRSRSFTDCLRRRRCLRSEVSGRAFRRGGATQRALRFPNARPTSLELKCFDIATAGDECFRRTKALCESAAVTLTSRLPLQVPVLVNTK